MRLRWRTFSAWVAAVLGLASCEKINDIIGGKGGIVCMYGMPTADYNIDFDITDEEGNGIPGIEVEVMYSGMAPVYSDEQGNVKFTKNDYPSLDMKLTDVDGEENGGEFKSLTVTDKYFDVKQTEKGSGSWYQGKYDVTGTIKMTRKENN